MFLLSEDLRIQGHPYLNLERGTRVNIELDGRVLTAYENESLGAALWANGVRTLARSFKLHRPRGLFCVSGNCPNCMMQVNGIPNVRVCQRKVRADDRLSGQNCWPSLQLDLMRIIDYFSFLFPTGFQYKRFIRPRFLWPLYSRVIRNLAGLGKLPTEASSKPVFQREITTDIVVVGGGLAGISAASSAASQGAHVVLLEETEQLGGRFNVQTQTLATPSQFSGLRAFEIASGLREELEHDEMVEALTSTTAFGYYEDGTIAAFSDDSLYRIKGKAVIICTGAYELPLIFENNDLPGVMLSSGVEVLMHRYGVRPGNVAVVAGVNERALDIAKELQEAGVEVKTVAIPSAVNRGVEGTGRVLEGWTLKRAIGRNSVRAAQLQNLETGRTEEVHCDAICVASTFRPANELLLQIGCEVSYESEAEGFVAMHDSEMKVRTGTYVAGEAAGTNKAASQILLEAELAGLAAAVAAGFQRPGCEERLDELKKQLEPSAETNLQNLPSYHGTKSLLCNCLDVTSKEVMDAIAEDHRDVETLKRYTGVTMGPCQGKLCLYALIGSLSTKATLTPNEVGIPTQRPPLKPVPIRLLAGDSHNEA